MIRKAIFWAATAYLGLKAYRLLSTPRSGSVPRLPRPRTAQPLNPVIRPELGEQLRSVVTSS